MGGKKILTTPAVDRKHIFVVKIFLELMKSFQSEHLVLQNVNNFVEFLMHHYVVLARSAEEILDSAEIVTKKIAPKAPSHIKTPKIFEISNQK